jgi:AAA domain
MAARVEPAHNLIYAPNDLPLLEPPPNVEGLVQRVQPLLDEPLNDEQIAAIRLSFRYRISLVWGPPGTGKTSALAALVLVHLEAAEESSRPISIALGASNWNAIDDLQGKVLTLTARRRIAIGDYRIPVEFARVRSDYGEPLPSGSPVRDVPRRGPAGQQLIEELAARDRALIVGGTWQQLSKLAGDGGEEPSARWFDLLILDEASQLKVAPAAGYFLLLREEGQVVLAGDPRQLGPIYAFEVRNTAGGLLDCIFTYLSETHGVVTTPLLRNYRTNLEISDWPRRRFYDARYAPVIPDRRLNLVPPPERPATWPAAVTWDPLFSAILDPNLPVVAITYPGLPYTLSNPFEAQIVAALATLYRIALPRDEVNNREFWDRRLGIVSPHRAQVSTIRNLIKSARSIFGDAPPAIDTVDRFQGQERDVILASYVVSDRDFIRSEERFILDPRRFNVTLTRARTKFVLLMSDPLLQHLPADADVARAAAHIQLFVDTYLDKVDRNIELPYVPGAQPTITARLRGYWS